MRAASSTRVEERPRGCARSLSEIGQRALPQAIEEENASNKKKRSRKATPKGGIKLFGVRLAGFRDPIKLFFKPGEQRGAIPRAVEYLFKKVNEIQQQGQKDVALVISFLEVRWWWSSLMSRSE